FLTRFPQARVIAVEPDPANFRLLQQNLAPYGARATCLCAAIWSDSVGVVLDSSYRDGREWSRTVREPLPGEAPSVATVDIGALLKQGRAERIDILKIDVEKAEKVIFARNCEDWLERVTNLVIELHDDECRDVFQR